MIRRPRATFAAVIAAPRWAGLLATLLAVSFLVSAVFYSTAVGRQALVDQWERTAIAFGQPVDDASYREFQELSGQGLAYAAATSLMAGPVAALALAALGYGVFSRLRGGQSSFHQVVAVVVHASVILAVRQLVSAPIQYASESMVSPTTLVRFFSMLDEGSPAARFLGLIDLFVLWWLVVLAVGMSTLYGGSMRRLALQFVGVYLGVALLLAGVMAWLGGIS